MRAALVCEYWGGVGGLARAFDLVWYTFGHSWVLTNVLEEQLVVLKDDCGANRRLAQSAVQYVGQNQKCPSPLRIF